MAEEKVAAAEEKVSGGGKGVRAEEKVAGRRKRCPGGGKGVRAEEKVSDPILFGTPFLLA